MPRGFADVVKFQTSDLKWFRSAKSRYYASSLLPALLLYGKVLNTIRTLANIFHWRQTVIICCSYQYLNGGSNHQQGT